jgi:hypothetical protein
MRRTWLTLLATFLAAGCTRDEMVDYRAEGRSAPSGPGPVAMKVETKRPVSCEGKPDRILGTERDEGRFFGVQMADGTRLLLRGKSGRLMNLQVPDESLAHFVFVHRQETLRFEYQNVEVCLPQAGGPVRMQRLIGARAQSARYADWKRKPGAAEAAARALKAYIEKVFGK